MALAEGSGPRARVLVAGGGFAALEVLLALRALAADRVQLTLICPERLFHYRPAATVEVFGSGPPRAYDLRAIAEDLGAVYRQDRLDAVTPGTRSVRLGSGARLGYDALVLGLGARARAAVPGALTFRDQRDVPRLRAVLRELEAHEVARLVFVVPSGCTWPLPLYELALLCAVRAQAAHGECELTVVSVEPAPLHAFGSQGSQLVAEALSQAGVRFVGGCVAGGVRRDGSLELQFDGAIGADRVVAVPQLYAARVSGVPSSWWGFVPTDDCGRVAGLEGVYAAGDMTTFPIKQGGLAAQQADRIADTIATALGAPAGAGSTGARASRPSSRRRTHSAAGG